MASRCICEHAAGGGPSTHRATKHLSSCVHSDLGKTTARFKKRRIRPVPGTRRLIVVDEDETAES